MMSKKKEGVISLNGQVQLSQGKKKMEAQGRSKPHYSDTRIIIEYLVSVIDIECPL